MGSKQQVARSAKKDPVVEAFRAHVDVTLLEENLRLSVEERFLKLIELQRFAGELRSAGDEAAHRRSAGDEAAHR